MVAGFGIEERAHGPGGGCEHTLDCSGILECRADILTVAAGSEETVRRAQDLGGGEGELSQSARRASEGK